MVIYNHVDGAATIFSTMSVTFMINPMENDLNWSEQEHTKQSLKIEGGNINQCLIFGQV